MRFLLAYFLCVFASVSQANPWLFDVYLDETKIGQHRFTLENEQLTSQADFKVKVLFITAYEYHHQAVETWQGDCLKSLSAKTVENDVKTIVTGQLDGATFTLSDGQATQQLPACSMTFAYWNPAILQQKRLLNPQNAEYLDVTIAAIGEKMVTVGGQSMQAKGYEILGELESEPKLTIKVWYDQNDQWVALQSITPEGYLIDYRIVK